MFVVSCLAFGGSRLRVSSGLQQSDMPVTSKLDIGRLIESFLTDTDGIQDCIHLSHGSFALETPCDIIL